VESLLSQADYIFKKKNVTTMSIGIGVATSFIPVTKAGVLLLLGVATFNVTQP
jgi:hypothetical protein